MYVCVCVCVYVIIAFSPTIVKMALNSKFFKINTQSLLAGSLSSFIETVCLKSSSAFFIRL